MKLHTSCSNLRFYLHIQLSITILSQQRLPFRSHIMSSFHLSISCSQRLTSMKYQHDPCQASRVFQIHSISSILQLSLQQQASAHDLSEELLSHQEVEASQYMASSLFLKLSIHLHGKISQPPTIDTSPPQQIQGRNLPEDQLMYLSFHLTWFLLTISQLLQLAQARLFHVQSQFQLKQLKSIEQLSLEVPKSSHHSQEGDSY